MPKRSATICCRSTRRQRTTPWTARSGPVSTTSASCASCSAERRGGWPFDQLSLSPSGPRSLKRCTQSRSVWRSMPPIRAASARLIPSSTAASDSRRRLWLACLEAAARRRSSSAEKSTLTVTAVAMARILPHHGISSTSRGESPTSQNGRPLVLQPSPADSFLSGDTPPSTSARALQALWWAARGSWDRAHSLVQHDGTEDAAWVHAHLHRVEGDLENASYWYRKAGRPSSGDAVEAERTSIAAELLQRSTGSAETTAKRPTGRQA